MENYVYINGKKYRKGYTTGSCAAAASKASVYMLFEKKELDFVEIDTPSGITLKLKVCDVEIHNDFAQCSIIKDGGDDPDITTGLKIFAKASYRSEQGVNVIAGEGVGIVTQPGLKVEVGKPAINPVPMHMILKEVKEVIRDTQGVDILISVLGGAEIAKRTYNPKLGIIGGISILGTTGIVQPMSEDAWKDSVSLELNMLRAKGYESALFVFGNYGEKFCSDKLVISQERVVKISNFLGAMLDKALEYEFKSIILVGHAGKLIKVCGGIFNTHSRVADARMEIITSILALKGVSLEILQEVYASKTTDRAFEIIDKYGIKGVYQSIVDLAAKRCEEYSFGKIKVGVILYDSNNNMLAMTQNSNKIFEELK